MSESINRPFVHSFCIHSFMLLHVIFVLFESSAQVLVRQPTKRSAFFVLGDHFILGDILPRTRSTTARAIICLKEIVSNTRLDQFLTSAPGFCKQVTTLLLNCFSLLFCLNMFRSVCSQTDFWFNINIHFRLPSRKLFGFEH